LIPGYVSPFAGHVNEIVVGPPSIASTGYTRKAKPRRD
jgi:hypothetical protein